jgi:hypothetical protein
MLDPIEEPFDAVALAIEHAAEAGAPATTRSRTSRALRASCPRRSSE